MMNGTEKMQEKTVRLLLAVAITLISFYLIANNKTVEAAGSTYYVATTGSDTTGAGTLNNPWQTIQKAADIATAGDTVVIREGTYRETVTPAHSGTLGNAITFEAFDGETIIISGYDEVSGWTQDSGSIYKASVTMSFDHENQVLQDGEIMYEARWPNTSVGSVGIWDPNRGIADANSTATKLRDTELPDYDWTGATVWIQDDPLWSAYTQEVTGYGTGYLDMSYASPWANHNVAPGSKYIVYGVKDALDTAGEWYYANDTLYAWVPSGGNPGDAVEVKQRMDAFDLENKDYIVLSNLNILGATIKFNENSDFVTMESLNVKYPYYSCKTLPVGGKVGQAQTDKGVVLQGSNHILKNSEISWSSGSGVVLQGSNFDIINNFIHNHDFIGSYASPLEIGKATNEHDQFYNINKGHVISHNTITQAGRAALSYRGGI